LAELSLTRVGATTGHRCLRWQGSTPTLDLPYLAGIFVCTDQFYQIAVSFRFISLYNSDRLYLAIYITTRVFELHAIDPLSISASIAFLQQNGFIEDIDLPAEYGMHFARGSDQQEKTRH